MQVTSMRHLAGSPTGFTACAAMSAEDLAELDAMLHPDGDDDSPQALEPPDTFARAIVERRRQLGLAAAPEEPRDLDEDGRHDPFSQAIRARRGQLGLVALAAEPDAPVDWRDPFAAAIVQRRRDLGLD